MSQPTKNAQANELRAQARQLAAEIGDPSKEMTAEEFQKKQEAVKNLSIRADFIAGFTPEAEIERQGGESALAERMGVEGLTRVASPESAEPVADDVNAQADRLRTSIKRHFGSMAGYMRAMSNIPRLTGVQKSVMEQAGALTRTIVGTANDASGGEFVLPLQQEA